MATNFTDFTRMPQPNNPLAELGNLIPNFATGLQAGAMPQRIRDEAQARALANAINQVRARYAEPMAQGALSLQQAQIQKALRAPNPQLSALEKALEGAARIKERYGADSSEAKLAQAYANRIAQGSNGVSMTIDPQTGQPIVQVGGQSGRGGSGGLQQIGNDIFVKPTIAAQTRQFNRIAGSETVEPYIENIIDKLPEFQTAKGRSKLKLAGLSNYLLGTDFDAPSRYASGMASISEAAEGLLNEFGLNATGENVSRMEHILTPQQGESKEGYKRRVKEQAARYLNNKRVAQNALSRGFKIGEIPTDSQDSGALANQQTVGLIEQWNAAHPNESDRVSISEVTEEANALGVSPEQFMRALINKGGL